MVAPLQGSGDVRETPVVTTPVKLPPVVSPTVVTTAEPEGDPPVTVAVNPNLQRGTTVTTVQSQTTFPTLDGTPRSLRAAIQQTRITNQIPPTSPPGTSTSPGKPAGNYWDEAGSFAGAVGAAFHTGAIEVEADKLRDGHNGGIPDAGYAKGMANPYYAAQVKGTQMTYWATYLGGLPLAGSLTGGALSKIGENAINGRAAFDGVVETLSPARNLANVMGHASLEDALYWHGMDKNLDLSWLNASFGEDVGRALSTEVGSIPQSYFMGAGAFAAPFLGQYRANNDGKQNGFGFGGSNPVIDGIDAMSRAGDAAGAMFAGISGISGQRLGGTMRAAMGVNTLNAMMNGLAFADQLWRAKDYLGAGAATVLTTLNAFGQATAASAHNPSLSGTSRTLSITGAVAGLTLGVWQYLRSED